MVVASNSKVRGQLHSAYRSSTEPAAELPQMESGGVHAPKGSEIDEEISEDDDDNGSDDRRPSTAARKEKNKQGTVPRPRTDAISCKTHTQVGLFWCLAY